LTDGLFFVYLLTRRANPSL